MIRSDVLSCELTNVGSFSPYQDPRKHVYEQNSPSDSIYSDCGAHYPTNGYKTFEEKYQSSNVRAIEADGSCAQIKEDSSDEIRDDEAEQTDYPSCQKGAQISGSHGMQYTALQTLVPGYATPQSSNYAKPPYGSAGYYPGPFQRYHNYPGYPETGNVGHLYYHGQMSPAMGHSPPGLLPMGCMQPSQVGMFSTGNICVYLCNRDLWAKFHAHTCEMIITKQGR